MTGGNSAILSVCTQDSSQAGQYLDRTATSWIEYRGNAILNRMLAGYLDKFKLLKNCYDQTQSYLYRKLGMRSSTCASAPK